MATLWTRRQVLAQATIAAAAIHTLDPHELCCAPSAFAQTADKDLFALKKVGDGVYAAIAEARYKVNSNAAVIVTDDGVVVVDSHSKPSAARAVYKEIQAVTNKPVRKIINTHFHWDHWQGNEVYTGAEVIASQQTKENLTKPDVGSGGVPFIEKQIASLPKEIDSLKDQIQKATDPAVKKNLESNLQQAEAYLQELKSLKPVLPTRTVATMTTRSTSRGARSSCTSSVAATPTATSTSTCPRKKSWSPGTRSSTGCPSSTTATPKTGSGRWTRSASSTSTT